MRQKLITIESKDIDKYDIPQLYFDENVLLIVYDTFTDILYRYVHTPRIFVLPRAIYNKVMDSNYRITEHQIRADDHIIDNTNATIDGEPFFPKEKIKLDVQHDYLKKYREYIPEKTSASNLDNLENAMDYLFNIKVPVDNFDNLKLRLQRMKDFGDEDLANKLNEYFLLHKEDFIKAASLSIPFYDLNDISLSPLQTNNPPLYYKLHNDAGVYSWSGYSTFIDTLTRILFYTDVSNHITTFAKYLKEFKPVMVVYGILNYHLSQNIHEKTNKNKSFYNLLIKELK